MNPLISADQLIAMIDAPDTVIVDCRNGAGPAPGGGWRTESAMADWAAGRIPGAGLADFTRGLAAGASRWRNALPDPVAFAAAMGALGVGAGRRVALYDGGGGGWAARVWWMLRWIGFDDAMVLDGGLQAWRAAGGDLSTDAPRAAPARLTPRLRSGMFTDKAAVSARSADTMLIDALSAAQFSGGAASLGLAGHIPGAVNVPAERLTDADTGCYLPLAELARLAPEETDGGAIVYCGSGIAAATVAFTLHRLGRAAVTIYMPGLQEWASDPEARLAFHP